MTEAQIRQEAADARAIKVHDFVTKSWENLDSIDIIDSINSGNLDPLVYLLREEDKSPYLIEREFTKVIQDHFVQVAVDEVYQ